MTTFRTGARRARSMAACLALLAGGTVAALGAPVAHAQGWKPTRSVVYTIPAGPGGSVDQAVRMIKAIAEKRGLLDRPMVVENKPGGAGRVALAYFDQNPGDPHYLSVITYSMLTNHILGESPVTFHDYTPVAMLLGEYVTLSVRTESPIRDARDLVERLKKDPTSLSLGVASAIGNHIHVGVAKPLKVAGVDIGKMTVVAFRSSQESLTNLLGGHLDIMAATTPNLGAQMRAGRIRVLAVATPTRLEGPLSTIPTWKELGIDATYDSAQGVLAGKGLPPEAVAFWERFFQTVTGDPEWLEFLRARQLDPRYRNVADTRRELVKAYDETREVLRDMGLAKR